MAVVLHARFSLADIGSMATPRKYPPAAEIERAAKVIMNRLANRTDRWGSYWINGAGKTINLTEPTSTKVAAARKVNKVPKLTRPLLKRHIRQMFALNKCLPLGVHAISKENTCKWIAWDIDNHGDRIPENVTRAARDAIFGFVRNKLGLRCVVVDSGGGGWHIWVPLDKPMDSTEAHLVVHRVRGVGAKVWPPELGRPKIDAYPEAPIHNGPTHKKECGGGWLRLPGRHQRLREHVSTVAGRRRFVGLSVWECFEKVAKQNTPAKWRMALAEAKRLPPEPKKPRGSKAGNGGKAGRGGKDTTKEADAFDYSDWTPRRLTTQPLEESERRCREKRLVRAIVIEGHRSLDLAEKAVRVLYDRASGDSNDLADEAMRETLYGAVPETVQRIVGAQGYEWASRAEADRARRLYIEAAECCERNCRARYGLRARIARPLAEWLDGLYRKLRQRAEDGGAYFLATTILTCCPREGSRRTLHDFYLRDCHGNTRIKMIPPVRARTRGGGVGQAWIKQDKHKVFMQVLCNTPIGGKTRVSVVRTAVWSNKDNTQPLIIDASKLPIDRP